MEEPSLLCESDECCLQWWDHERNSEEIFLNIRRRARKFVYWKCPSCGSIFLARVDSVTTPYYPICRNCGKRGDITNEDRISRWTEEKEKYEKTLISEVPQLLEAWDDDRDPSTIPVMPQFSSAGKHDDIAFKFKCKHGHRSRMHPYTYWSSGCPICSALLSKENGSYSINPQQPELLAEWDYEKNGKLTPEKTSINSIKKIVWKCLNCGYNWEESPKDRLRSYASCCPNCKKLLGSIGWRFPELALEWSPSNPDNIWRVRSSVKREYIPEWICQNDPNHKWRATIQTRIRGQVCPFCNYSTSSKIEHKYYEAAKQYFEDVDSNCTVYEENFSHSWSVDILIRYHDLRIVVEYDGGFWHKRKKKTDIQKSMELIEAGYVVVRLREPDLESLPIVDSNYYEFTVHPLTIRYQETLSKVKLIIDSNYCGG